MVYSLVSSASTNYTKLCRVIHKSRSSRDGHAEGEHVNRGTATLSFCPTL